MNKARWWREYHDAALGPEGATVEGAWALLNKLQALLESNKRRVREANRSTRGRKRRARL
jgi:hypothetical protein